MRNLIYKIITAAALKVEERREQLAQMREEEELRVKQLASREFQEAKKIAEIKQKKQEEILIQARENEKMRKKKSEARRLKTKNILKELERQGDER